MTKIVEYIGPADVRTIGTEDFAASGFDDHPPVTWRKPDGFEVEVEDSVALWLVAQDESEFKVRDFDDFVDVLDEVFLSAIALSPTGRSGLLANRPAIGSVVEGSLYSATDDAGGTLYVAEEGAWVALASGRAAIPMPPVANQAALPASGNSTGHLRTDNATGHGWMWNGSAWVDLGQFRGIDGDDGVPSAIVPGLLSARPAANSVLPGTEYFATNDQGGTKYVSNGTSWIKAGPSVNDTSTGRLLASCWPTAIATVTADGSGDANFPELTTGTFVWPTGPVRVITPAMTVSFSALASTPFLARIGVFYRIDGGAWSHARFIGPITGPVTGGTAMRCPSNHTRIPYPQATGAAQIPDPGDLVEVKLVVGGLPAGTTNVDVNTNALFGDHAGFDVVQF